MTSLNRIRNYYTLIETWELELVEMPERVERFDRAIAAVRAEAWNEAAREAHACGWLHDFALSDVIGRNPYTADAREDT